MLSRLDHDANVRPWVQTAARRRRAVRWAEVDVAPANCPSTSTTSLLNERTRLVAVTAASNVLGTRPDVARIARRAHAAGALVYVDGVHAAAHGPVDMVALGADFYATSAYKWSGPHVGAVVADPALLDTLRPDKLASSPDEVPARFETGTAPFADLAGVTAAVDHLAAGRRRASGSRRDRLLASMAAAEDHELRLFAHLFGGLAAMPHVSSYGRAARRTATAYFTVAGRTPARRWPNTSPRRRVNVWHGHNYAWELTGRSGSAAPARPCGPGLVHYNDSSDVDRLLDGVAELAG